MVEGTPPGEALPPPPQRATPGRKGARCGAGAGAPRPHRPYPGHTGRGAPAARSRGRAAGGGTAPDTRRLSQRWQATPPGDGPPPPPRHAAPTGHAGQEDSVGPPHPHTRAHSTGVADLNSLPSGRAVGGGTAPDTRSPSQWWKAPPPGTPFPPAPQRATPARKGARCGAGARSPRPQVPHLGHTGRGTLAARSRGWAAGGETAPDTTHPSQRWQATPPRDGPPPPPRHAAPTGHAGEGDSVGSPHPHTRARSTWVADPNSPPSGRAFGGGTAPALRRPSQWWKAPPPGTPFRHPHSEQRRPARAHAVGPVLGPQTRTDRSRDTWVAEPWPPAPEDGRPGEGQRLTPDAPHSGGRPPPRGTAPHHPPTGHAGQGDSVRAPHQHTHARSTWVADPNSPPSRRAVRGGTAPDLRRPSQRWKALPPETPFRHPHSKQRWPIRAHAVGPVLDPHAGTDPTRDTRVAEPRPPAPEDGRPGEGQRLTPDAPHNGGRPPPRGRTPTTPAARSPHRACRPSQVGRNRDRTAPPQARQTEQGTEAGHAEGYGPRGMALPAPSAGTARGAHATPPRGGRADAAGAQAHTHAKGTRGLPEGQPNRARGTHRPRGMAYPRARVRDTQTGRPATGSAGHRGRKGFNGRDTTPGTGPSPPNRP